MRGAASPWAGTWGSAITVSSAGKTFTRSSGSFIADGFKTGIVFKTTGFTNPGNNGTFTVSAAPTATTITCSAATGLVNEGPTTANLLIQQPGTVVTPIMDPVDSTKGFGYSSVFALDVTDPITSDLSSGAYPKLLWEFSDPRLGFTTVIPAIVRIKDPADAPGLQRNGKWYAVLASGPSGPITNGWFMGQSDRKLTIFVLDLKSGALVRTFSSAATGGSNTQFLLPVDAPAFAGSLSGATTDTDKFDSSRTGAYSDDAIYIGYTRANSATTPTAWDKGGVLRLLTYNDPNPANWKLSALIDGIGPVTSAVTKLQDATKSQLWLYFGTGRYYTKDDDPSNVQSLFGLKDPCFSTGNVFSGSVAAPCTTTIGSSADPKGTLDNRTTVSDDAVTAGWYINLPAGNGTTTYPKRVITDTLANTNGVVNFTTFIPSRDVCSYGGETSVWAVKFDTGGSGASKLKGQLLMQLSTGAFQQIDLSSAFTESGQRETVAFKGVPPATPPALTSNTNHFPTKRFLHIQER
jgi:type IV pilus assembly protein PilY1